jgi:flagellar biosynthesis GTPase FlhF
MHTIYLVRKDSKPVYVGYTSRTLENRWSQHISQSKKPKYPIHRAIKKHGVDSFSIETLYESEDGEHTLNFMEHHYIWLYRTHGSLGGYNMTIGGEGKQKGLTEKQRKEQNKAKNEAWYKANKEKVKSRLKAHREANKEKVKAQEKARREANKEKVKARKKAYYEANKEKKKAQEKAWREANKEKVKAQEKAWREANRDRANAYRKVWREAKRKTVASMPPSFSE